MQKNKNLFNIIKKSLKSTLDSRGNDLGYRRFYIMFRSEDLYKYQMGVRIGYNVKDVIEVHEGNNVYFCAKVDPTVMKDEIKSNLDDLVDFFVDISKNDYGYSRGEDFIKYGMNKDGIRIPTKLKSVPEMTKDEVKKTKAYKKLEEAIIEVCSSTYKFELKNGIYKAFKTRRDLLPLITYYGSSDDIRYVSGRSWSYGPTRGIDYSREFANVITYNPGVLKTICYKTVSNSSMGWFDLSIDSKLSNEVWVRNN